MQKSGRFFCYALADSYIPDHHKIYDGTKQLAYKLHKLNRCVIKGCRMGRSDKVSLWCVALLINTSFHFFLILE